MALTPGTCLGPYEVTAQIEWADQVYRAIDTNLKQSVAIKVLPTSVAADAERLARFQPEAEVLAALNHPHIAGIYGLEKSDDRAPGIHGRTHVSSLSRALRRSAAKARRSDSRLAGSAVEPPNGARHDAEVRILLCERGDPRVCRRDRGTTT